MAAFLGDFVSSLSGLPGSLIMVKPLGAAKPKISGSLTVNGQYVVFQDLEIYYSWPSNDRTTEEAGSNPTTGQNTHNLSVNAPGAKFINCVIHDLSGVSTWNGALGAEFYGCAISYIGWSGPDRAHGHALYTQNPLTATTRKTIKRCQMFSCFGYNMHIYGSDGAMSHYDIEENTCFNAGILEDGTSTPWYGIMIGSGAQAVDDRVVRNMTYNNGIGYYSFGQGINGLLMLDNYMPDACLFNPLDVFDPASNQTSSTWLSFPPRNPPYPTSGKQIFVYDNEYKAGAGFVTIYNWDHDDSVVVDLTPISTLDAGDQITLWDVQAGAGAGETTHTLDASKRITVDMRAVNHTVANPKAWAITPGTTFPEFGTFWVRKAEGV